jgi:GTP-binding protein
MSLPVVAIVGRPNVGKSRLFNRLAGRKKAVVDDQSGVTRDRLYQEVELLEERRAMLIDTGGIEPDNDTDLLRAMRRQSLIAIEEADVILFTTDGKSGLTPADADVADLLRRTSKPVLLVVNKIDGPQQEDEAAEFYQLGVTPLFTVSAAHGRGIWELLEGIIAVLPPPTAAELEPRTEEEEVFDIDEEALAEGILDEEVEEDAKDMAKERGPMRIAIVGRPNIGKSTLVNKLLGEDRHLVHDMPGTTMDPVDSLLTVGDKEYLLVATAGVRRKSKIDTQLERFVSLRSIRMIERCHIVLLVVDSTEGITEQDARIADLVVQRGRGLVLLFNKWDQVKDMEDVDAAAMEGQIEHRLPHAEFAPYLFISAKTGKGCHRILPMVEKVYESFDRRISTANFNRFLERAVLAHSPPQNQNHPVRLYYGAQARVRPPTFVIFSNAPDNVAVAYKRYLQNRLREAFDFEGTPLRMRFKERRKLGVAKHD